MIKELTNKTAVFSRTACLSSGPSSTPAQRCTSSGPALAALFREVFAGGRTRALCAAGGIALVAVLNAAAAFVIALFDGVGCVLVVHAGVLLDCAAMAVGGALVLVSAGRPGARPESAEAPHRRIRNPTASKCEQGGCEGVQRVAVTMSHVDSQVQTDDVVEMPLRSADEDMICELAAQVEVLGRRADRDRAELRAQRHARAAAEARAEKLERALVPARARSEDGARDTEAALVAAAAAGETRRRLKQCEAEVAEAEADEGRAGVLEAALAECEERAARAEAEAQALKQQLDEAQALRQAELWGVVGYAMTLEKLAAALQTRAAQSDTAVAQLCCERQVALLAIAQLQQQLVAASAARDAATGPNHGNRRAPRANRAIAQGLGLVVTRAAQSDTAVAQLCCERQVALLAIAQLQQQLVAASAARDAATGPNHGNRRAPRANRAIAQGLGLVVVAEALTLAGAGSPSAPSPALSLACARSVVNAARSCLSGAVSVLLLSRDGSYSGASSAVQVVCICATPEDARLVCALLNGTQPAPGAALAACVAKDVL
eukprot:m51a1_g12679 hypothetical protein (549) ;mRNA; r:1248-3254